jgi:hypothetical protein
MVVLSPIDNGALLAFVFQILRWGRYYRAWEYATIFTDAGAIHNYGVGADPGTFANLPHPCG